MNTLSKTIAVVALGWTVVGTGYGQEAEEEKVQKVQVVEKAEVVTASKDQQDRGLKLLNTGGVEDLMKIKRVGPVLAARIVADRAENGEFTSLDGFTRVKGVGVATLRNLVALVTPVVLPDSETDGLD